MASECLFKFQSDSINTASVDADNPYISVFKFQSDSINTVIAAKDAVDKDALNSNLILLIRRSYL